MKKCRYTKEQISFALQQAEHGTPVKEVIRKLGRDRNFTAGSKKNTAAWVRPNYAG